jgi:uncharacterized protein
LNLLLYWPLIHKKAKFVKREADWTVSFYLSGLIDFSAFQFCNFSVFHINNLVSIRHMKLIGLLSDTHGHLDDRIIYHLKDCDEIWHAGDIGTMEVLDQLEKLKPVKAVFGNIDGHLLRAALPEILRFTCEKVNVLLKHIGGYPGHYDHSVVHELMTGAPKLFIAGHSHILKVIPDKKLNLLHINPGAAGNSGLHKVRTLIRFRIDGDNIRDLEVVELEKRY